MTHTILITGACGVTSRAIARSLRASPVYGTATLVGTDTCETPYALHEGLFNSIWRVPHVSEQRYEAVMSDIVARTAPHAALIMPELEVLHWSRRVFPCPAMLPPPKFCQIAVSKARLYSSLDRTGLVPRFIVADRTELTRIRTPGPVRFPCWIRDVSEGASSGRGALLAHSPEDLAAWVTLNPGIQEFMVSDYLPGGNFACHLLFREGRVLKVGCYERSQYFMGRTVMSGISGNISKGRLVNDARLVDVSMRALKSILSGTGEVMNGLVAIDLRESAEGVPMVTEINLRHVAATYAFAQAGFNLAEAHLMATLGEVENLGSVEPTWPPHNVILRDIDGYPIWLPELRLPDVGSVAEQSTARASSLTYRGGGHQR